MRFTRFTDSKGNKIGKLAFLMNENGEMYFVTRDEDLGLCLRSMGKDSREALTQQIASNLTIYYQ